MKTICFNAPCKNGWLFGLGGESGLWSSPFAMTKFKNTETSKFFEERTFNYKAPPSKDRNTGIDLKELKQYRDLIYFMVWREVKVLYAQTVLGFSWALLQPLVQIVIFTIVFGKVAQVSSDGIPYFLFSSVAIIPWTYMSQAMTQSSQSLVQGQHMLGKVYFPRLIFPLTPVLARLIDFGISILILFVVALYYHVVPTWNLIFLPIFVLLMMAIPAGIGLWLSALAIRFRDVKHAMPFVVRMLIYTAPIVYSASSIPDAYRLIYSLNPRIKDH